MYAAISSMKDAYKKEYNKNGRHKRYLLISVYALCVKNGWQCQNKVF